MNRELRNKLSNLESYALYTQNDFLKRVYRSADHNVTNVITDVTDEQAVAEKIKKIYGDAKTERGDGYVIIPPIDLFDKEKYSYEDLLEIIHRLLDPDGCPWDKAQTPGSIRTNIIEEAYELIEAIDLNDDEKMREECGDVILQGTFCSVMTEKDGRFDASDVITALCKKLIFRHTHIFGKDKALDAADALKFWEQAKAKEKRQKSVQDKLDVVPSTFTALQRAYKVQKIIKKTGFDFADEKQAIDKIYEEIDEFVHASGEEREKEAGDMLFSVVNVLRMNNIDPEVALFGTSNRFEKRFRYVLQKADEQGKKIEDMSLGEMEELYCEAKKIEREDKL